MKACKNENSQQLYKNKNKVFKTRARDTYLQTQLFLHNTNEYPVNNFKSIVKLKTQYNPEKYLKIKNFGNRKALSKLRLGCHNLLSETSKWGNTDDICNRCNSGEIENEFHFLFECKKYLNKRENTFQLINKNDDIDLTKVKSLNEINNFFENASLYSINLLGDLVKKSFEERDNIRYRYIVIF